MQKLPPSDTALSIKMPRQLKEKLNQIAIHNQVPLARMTKIILNQNVDRYMAQR